MYLYSERARARKMRMAMTCILNLLWISLFCLLGVSEILLREMKKEVEKKRVELIRAEIADLFNPHPEK